MAARMANATASLAPAVAATARLRPHAPHERVRLESRVQPDADVLLLLGAARELQDRAEPRRADPVARFQLEAPVEELGRAHLSHLGDRKMWLPCTSPVSRRDCYHSHFSKARTTHARAHRHRCDTAARAATRPARRTARPSAARRGTSCARPAARASCSTTAPARAAPALSGSARSAGGRARSSARTSSS